MVEVAHIVVTLADGEEVVDITEEVDMIAWEAGTIE